MDILLYLKEICFSVVFPVLLSFFQEASSTSFTMFQFETKFDGYRCNPSDSVFETISSNIQSCTKACFMDNVCNSLFYQQEFGKCVGCSGFFHNYMRLNGSNECTSVGGRLPLFDDIPFDLEAIIADGFSRFWMDERYDPVSDTYWSASTGEQLHSRILGAYSTGKTCTFYNVDTQSMTLESCENVSSFLCQRS